MGRKSPKYNWKTSIVVNCRVKNISYLSAGFPDTFTGSDVKHNLPFSVIAGRPNQRERTSMSGDYPSADFEIADEGTVRRVSHLPTGMVIETGRVHTDPIAVPATYMLQYGDHVARSGEIVQAALRHLRVWLMRRRIA
ncbi:MAG TPA: hypothetical protein VHW66_22975 [Stellaceae bacterium]|nr:hypothetical protein [Stellaceae bacterium]